MTLQMTKTLAFIIILFIAVNCLSQTIARFEYYQRLIFCKVKVNNADSLLFLFDTGANTSAIDEKIAEKFKLKVVKIDSVEGTVGTIRVPSVKVKSLSVGNSIVKNMSLTKYNLSGSLAPPGQHLSGILGTDFLKHFVVMIDFGSSQISFKKKSDRSPFSLPFELDNGIPRVSALINDSTSTFFRYDSGSSLFETNDIYINTTTSVLEKLRKSDSTLKPLTYFSATGVGGNIKIPVYQIHSLLLGSLEIKKTFLIVQPEQGYFARADAVGFFGNNLLEKFQKVTIDFINGKIYTQTMGK